MDKTDLLKEANKLLPTLIKIRRRIHQWPETGFNEHKTSRLVKNYLKRLKLDSIETVATTGVVVLLKGKNPGKTIAFRADMDALSIQESSFKPYKSKVPGIMHACGHDGHTAILLGTAILLNKFKNKIKGNVKFIFQPAEEGPGGALPMVQAKVLENPKVNAIFGLHLNSDIDTGKIAFGHGIRSAACDEFRITIFGKSGHAARPEETVDAIVVAASVIQQIQTIISRRISPIDPAVISVGTISGGCRHNIIADQVVMTGTVRSLDKFTRIKLNRLLKKTLKNITANYGARFKLEYEFGYPSVINNEKLTKFTLRSLQELLSKNKVNILTKPTTGSEDFSYFTEKVPGVFLRLGGRNKYFKNPLHSNKFDFDEKALTIGVAAFSKLALDYLS